MVYMFNIVELSKLLSVPLYIKFLQIMESSVAIRYPIQLVLYVMHSHTTL